MLTLDQANDLVVNNMRLVQLVANKYRVLAKTNGIDFNDICSVGNIGLILASRSFDLSRGFKFSTYASHMIMDQIIKYLNKNMSMLKIPRNTVELSTEIIRNLWTDRSPNEIAKETGKSLKAVNYALQSINTRTVSTESNLGYSDDSSTIGESLPYDDDFTQLHVDEFLQTLSDNEIQLLNHLSNGLTQTDIGKLVGKSQMSICRQLADIRWKFKSFERSTP